MVIIVIDQLKTKKKCPQKESYQTDICWRHAKFWSITSSFQRSSAPGTLAKSWSLIARTMGIGLFFTNSPITIPYWSLFNRTHCEGSLLQWMTWTSPVPSFKLREVPSEETSVTLPWSQTMANCCCLPQHSWAHIFPFIILVCSTGWHSFRCIANIFQDGREETLAISQIFKFLIRMLSLSAGWDKNKIVAEVEMERKSRKRKTVNKIL